MLCYIGDICLERRMMYELGGNWINMVRRWNGYNERQVTKHNGTVARYTIEKLLITGFSYPSQSTFCSAVYYCFRIPLILRNMLTTRWKWVCRVLMDISFCHSPFLVVHLFPLLPPLIFDLSSMHNLTPKRLKYPSDTELAKIEGVAACQRTKRKDYRESLATYDHTRGLYESHLVAVAISEVPLSASTRISQSRLLVALFI